MLCVVPCVCWKDNAAGHKQSSRFLETISDNFLIQVTEEPTRGSALLDLILTNKQGLVRIVKVYSSFAAVTVRWWSSGS